MPKSRKEEDAEQLAKIFGVRPQPRVEIPFNVIERPEDIVGHKTMADGSHLPLRRDEADTIFEAADAARAQRERDMPTEQSAIAAMQEAFTRLKELGWREAIYCPKDGSQFFMIEPGSTGIHQGHYQGKWPNGYWTDGDYGMRPCLFKLSPEDEAKRKAKMAHSKDAHGDDLKNWLK